MAKKMVILAFAVVVLISLMVVTQFVSVQYAGAQTGSDNNDGIAAVLRKIDLSISSINKKISNIESNMQKLISNQEEMKSQLHKIKVKVY
ncbi:MAG: hypothetical protein ABH872_03055 [Candidatus Omnitrophota bacterium]